MVLKCKICGGSLAFEQGISVATCEYCGNKQTVPVVRDERVTLSMYEKANAYRVAYEFDNAINLYNQIILDNEKDAEAYWDLALCKYGVVYVKDPNTGRYIPTCSRAQYDSILEDENYKKALEFADEQQKSVFQMYAEYIDDVEKRIIKIAKNEEPFDIFICYKESDGETGKRSSDSINANKIYDMLTEAGYKVFFSRITLESKVGIEYEPYIYAALSSSKVMIHITSSKENSESVWVKNEWSRYLALLKKDTHKTFIPVYYDTNKDELPIEFKNIPSYDFSEEGFEDELLRGIKKLIPSPLGKKNTHANWFIPVVISVVCVVGIGVGAVLYANKKADEKTAEAIATAVITTEATTTTTTEATTQETEDPELLAAYDAAVDLAYEGRYAEAAWAFADLGDFKDSPDKYEQMIKSWRISCSSVVAHVEQNWGYSSGSYYIDGNGSVETFVSDPGFLNQDMDINENGKVVSITSGLDLIAIRENGVVDGYNIDDAIEVSPMIHMYDYDSWNEVLIILHEDGTVSYIAESKLGYDSFDENYNTGWLDCLSSWSDIIDIVCVVDNMGNHNYTVEAAILGLKSDGTLVYTGMPFYQGGELMISGDTPEWVGTYTNVVRLDDSNGAFILYLDDNTIYNSYTGNTIDNDGQSIISITPNMFFLDDIDEFYSLSSDGTVTDGNNNEILYDVVYLKDLVAVTNSGKIYVLNNYWDGGWSSGTSFSDTSLYTSVPDEWLMRLN